MLRAALSLNATGESQSESTTAPYYVAKSPTATQLLFLVASQPETLALRLPAH